MLSLYWFDADLGLAPDLCFVPAGVYVIRDVLGTRKVGQGNPLPSRLSDHRRAQTRLEEILKPRVYWAQVPLGLLDGVETFLGHILLPRDAERFPDVTPISANLPYRLEQLAPFPPVPPVRAGENALARLLAENYGAPGSNALTSWRNRLLP